MAHFLQFKKIINVVSSAEIQIEDPLIVSYLHLS